MASLDASLPDGPPADNSKRIEGGPTPIYTEASDQIITRSLLVGDLEAAVDCCLQNNQLTDALLLASQGGPELWNKTQEYCFSVHLRPFMRIVKALMKNDLVSFVEEVIHIYYILCIVYC